jgi:hypothetical protein
MQAKNFKDPIGSDLLESNRAALKHTLAASLLYGEEWRRRSTLN